MPREPSAFRWEVDLDPDAGLDFPSERGRELGILSPNYEFIYHPFLGEG